MERGAARFFPDLPDPDRRLGRSVTHLSRVVSTAGDTLALHPSFVRLLIVFAIQPPRAGNGEVRAVVRRVRELALAAFDGAFVASQADSGITLDAAGQPLAPALVAARRSLLQRPSAG